uniref:Integral membrane protein 2 n=1 Tax=Amphiprion percula TaxID=161767 RepID=A0A3P8TQR8_AMPPE
MVKVSFNSALAQKDVKKDAETLIPEEDKDAEAALLVRHQSRAWCWCCVLGLALMLSGVVVGEPTLYRYYEGQVFVCGVNYREEDFMIQEEDEVRPKLTKCHLISSSESLSAAYHAEFDDGDPADIVHDFQRVRGLTAYLDLSLNKCYVIPLNTSIVMPPRDFLELLVNVKAGTYLPQSYLVQREMVVTERLEHVEQLGYFIHNLCQGKDTYKLQRRDRILGMQKREALNCHKIRHFENKFVVETVICEP